MFLRLSLIILPLLLLGGGKSTILAKATHHITYYVNGVKNVVERTEGESLSLTSPSACGTMPFYKWSTANSAENPVFVSNTMKVTDDMTLYAVYTKTPADSCYKRVTSALSDWRGKYLIAKANDRFADGSKGGIGTDCIGKSGNTKAPGKDLDTVTDEVSLSWGDKYYVKIEAINDDNLSAGYVMKTIDKLYNYPTGSSDLSTNVNKSTASGHPITISFVSSANIRLYSEGKYFQYYDNMFRFFSSRAGEPIYLYKRTVTPAVYSLGLPEMVTITDAKYATYATNRALDFSGTGITAYTANADGSVVRLSPVEDGIVPANTGIILYKEEAGDVEVPFVVTDKAALTNELVGTSERVLVSKTDEGRYNYILQKSGDNVVFNMAKEGGAYMPANRAYLSTTVCAAARMTAVFGDDEETSGMEMPSSLKPSAPVYYNLSGQQVERPYVKGLYIVRPADGDQQKSKKIFVR